VVASSYTDSFISGSQEWEVRHGGLLGLKYLLAIRGESLGGALLAQLFPPIHAGLTDPSDDVIAVAASALLPVVPLLISQLAEGEEVGQLAATLWTALLDLDDLTCSAHAILVLLSDLLSTPGGLELALKSNRQGCVDPNPKVLAGSESISGSEIKSSDKESNPDTVEKIILT
jgi:hypothetical protein